MTGLMGIDLNGLCDVSVDAVDGGVLSGGSVPSVVVIQSHRDGEPLRVIAGKEAAMAVEGRGWHWPPSAQVHDEMHSLRVPLHRILKALVEGKRVEVAGEDLPTTELLGAAIDALARPRGAGVATAEARPAVIAVPDDGHFLEEARQRLIDAAVLGGLTPTLLWRPVAALLGLEAQFDSRDAQRLSGRTIGVLSCLEEGVHAARLEIEVRTDDNGESYIVPVRRSAGIAVPYRYPISALAANLANRYAPVDDPQDGWQLLWGDGLTIRWLLHLQAEDAVVQTSSGWRLISGRPPQDVPMVEFDDLELDKLASFLEGVNYKVIEGPALEATACGERLLYFLTDRIGRSAPSLNFATQSEHLAARGCAVYQRRIAQGRHTYFDYLPQLRLAVRRGTHPDFLDLIDREARVEGGMIYEVERDLSLSVSPGTAALNFYLLREGNAKPRHVQEKLLERITAAVPVRLRIRQQPAQGTARLTLVAADLESGFRPVELSWERMTEENLSEEEVLHRLGEEKSAEVPPLKPQPCHALLWTARLTDMGGSLTDVVPRLAAELDQDHPLHEEIGALLLQHSVLLTRRASPMRLTRKRVRDDTLYRAVSSDGDLPEPNDDLPQGLLALFDDCLSRLDNLMAGADAGAILSASVRMAGWCFVRCPDGLRQHLLDTARHGQVPDTRIYFRAMGKVFAEKEECQAFFSLLEQRLTVHDATFKLYEIEGFFYLFSLREDAPRFLSDTQALLFASMLLARIDERVQSLGRLSRLVNVSLKAYAGLMRYRLVRPGFMTPQDPKLGERQKQVLQSLLARSRRDKREPIARLTTSLIEWSEKRGTDRTILQWDEDE